MIIKPWGCTNASAEYYTKLLKKLDVIGAQVEELWSMEKQSYEMKRQACGLIFCCDNLSDEDSTGAGVPNDLSAFSSIYFARQNIINANSVQALLHLLFNFDHPDITLGQELTNFKMLSVPHSPKMRGCLLGKSEPIRVAHNYFAEEDFSKFEDKINTYNHIVYLPINGRLYELDSQQDSPIDHGIICPDQAWIDIVWPIVSNRMDACLDQNMSYNLMALVSNRKLIYERQFEDLIEFGFGMDPQEFQKEILRLSMLIEQEDLNEGNNML